MKTSKILACLSAAAFAGSMLSMVSFADVEYDQFKIETVKLNGIDFSGALAKTLTGESDDTNSMPNIWNSTDTFTSDDGNYSLVVTSDSITLKDNEGAPIDITSYELDGEYTGQANKYHITENNWANQEKELTEGDVNLQFTITNSTLVNLGYIDKNEAPKAINVDLPLSKEGMNAQAILFLRSESAKVDEENPQMQDGGWENINKLQATVRVSDAYAKSGEWYGGAFGVNVKRPDDPKFEKSWTQLGTFDNTTIESIGNNLYTITYTAPEGKTLWTDGDNGEQGIGEDPCIQLWVAHWATQDTEFANAGQTDFAVMNISAYDANGLVISANNTTPDPLPGSETDDVKCPCGCGCTAETCKVWDTKKQCCGCGCAEAVKIDGEVTLFDGTTATWNNAETASPFSIQGDGEYEIKLNTKAWDDIETPIALNPKNLAGDNGGTDMVFCLDFLDAMVDTGETETRKDRDGNDNADAKKYDKVYPDFDVEITDILANDKSIFDASKATGIVKGNTEDNGKYRVSLFNSWNKFENNDPDKTGLTLPTTNITDLTIKIKVSGLGSMSGKCKCEATKGIELKLQDGKEQVVENTRAFKATGKYGFVFKGDTIVGEGVADTDLTFSVDKPEALAVSAPAADNAAATAGEGETTGVTVKTDKDGNAIVELKPGEVSEDTDVVLTAKAADGTTASTTIKVKNSKPLDPPSSEGDPKGGEPDDPTSSEDPEEEEPSSTTSSTASSSTASTAAATTASAGATDNNPATGAAALGTVGLLLAGAALAVSKKKD